jgi:hypothetical protein
MIKRTILAAAMTLALAAPAHAQTYMQDNNTPPSTVDNPAKTDSDSDTAQSPVDLTIRDLQSAKANLGNVTADRNRNKVMKEIENALSDLQSVKNKESK